MSWLVKINCGGPGPLLLGAHLIIIVGGLFTLVGKNQIEGARAPWINIIVNCYCTRRLLYTKMLKETEETIVFFMTFLSLAAFQLGGGGLLPGYAHEIA